MAGQFLIDHGDLAVRFSDNRRFAAVGLFGEGGGEKLATQYGVELLASLPLSMVIREQADGGKPTVIAEPDSPVSYTHLTLPTSDLV